MKYNDIKKMTIRIKAGYESPLCETYSLWSESLVCGSKEGQGTGEQYDNSSDFEANWF